MIPSDEYASLFSAVPPATKAAACPAVIEALYVVGPKVNAVDAYALVKSAFAEVAAVHVSPSAE